MKSPENIRKFSFFFFAYEYIMRVYMHVCMWKGKRKGMSELLSLIFAIGTECNFFSFLQTFYSLVILIIWFHYYLFYDEFPFSLLCMFVCFMCVRIELQIYIALKRTINGYCVEHVIVRIYFQPDLTSVK